MRSFDIRNDLSDPVQSDMDSRSAWPWVLAVMALASISFVVHVVVLQMAHSDATRVAGLSGNDDVFPNGHELAELMSSFTAPDVAKSDSRSPLSSREGQSHVVAGR